MSARGFATDLHPSLDLKGDHFSVMQVGASSGDKMTAQGDVTYSADPASTRSPPAVSPAEYRFPPASISQQAPFAGKDTCASSSPSSPSDSRSASPSALRNGTLTFSLHQPPPPPEACTGTLELVHPTPTSATPELPPYRPLPPLSPLSILSTLDQIASSAPKKKSHARKQPAGHIPRPRNAFILFRCLFVSQQAVPASVEKDHRNISRIAGRVWKSMSESERDPWIKAAELEKSRHEERWPGYRYNPVQTQAALRRLTGAAASAAGGRTTSHGPAMGLGSEERRGRTMARSSAKTGADSFRMKGEGEDAVRYASQQQQQQQQQQHHPQLHLHAPLARVASVPPPSSRPQGLFEQWRGEDVDVLDVDGDAEMMPPPPPSLQHQHQQSQVFAFTMPAAPTTPTPMNSGRLPASGSSSASYMWDDPFPPASPPPFPVVSHRLSARRSSSCPPLPPPGMITFPFNNPAPWNSMATSFANACSELDRDVFQSLSEPESPSSLPFRNPFSSTASAVSSGVTGAAVQNTHPYSAPSRPSTPPSFTNPFSSSPSPFAYVFPGGYTGRDVQAGGAMGHGGEELDQHRPLRMQHQHLQHEDQRPLTAPYEHRPFTAPECHFQPPRPFMHGHGYGHGHGFGDTSSRLMHRRGSSLDRAIASSSIAGAMGGLTRSTFGMAMGYGHGHGYAHAQGLGSQPWGEDAHHQPQQHGGEARETSSYTDNTNAQQEQYFSLGGNAKLAGDASLCSSGTGTPALSPSPPSSFEGSSETQAPAHAASMYHTQDDDSSAQQQQLSPVAVVPESFTPAAPTPSSCPEPFALPPTGSSESKVPARLFGSQGARLGLDLDLDIPLSLDVSFATAASSSNKDDGMSAATTPPYSSISTGTSYSSLSASTSYSSLGTPASYGVSDPSTMVRTTSEATLGPPPGTASTTATSCRSENGDADEDSSSFPYTPASPSPFLYTQALLDMNHHSRSLPHQQQHRDRSQQHQMNVGGEEFKFGGCAMGVRVGTCDDERRAVSPVHAS